MLTIDRLPIIWRHAFPQDAPSLQELCLQLLVVGMRLDLGEVGQRLPANCRAPSCVTTNGTSATIEDAVDAAAQLRDPFAFNDRFTPEADNRPMALLTQTGSQADKIIVMHNTAQNSPGGRVFFGLRRKHP